MNSSIIMVIALFVGLVLGTLFFGGLWYTVKKAVTSGRPALWLFGSFLARTGVVLVGFYYCAQGDWQRILVCLLGFIAARYMVIRFVKTTGEKQVLIKEETSHETES